MQSGRLFAVIGLIAALPTVVLAQGSSGIQILGSQNNSIPGGAGLAGVGMTIGAGPIGVRGTFGVTVSTFRTSAAGTTPPNFGRWSGDADLIVADDFFQLQLLNGLIHPYGFAGVGAHSARASQSMNDAIRTWSYGGGVALPLSRSLSLEGEIRKRAPLGSAVVSPVDFVRGNEMRVGIEYRFGASGATSSRSTIGSARATWPTSGSVKATGAARRVVPTGERYLGVPYIYGGSTPKGFDCSGFVQYIYRHEGVELPRTSRQMAASGFAVDPSTRSMAVGDLMLFAQDGPISHVAIYAGNGRFIHSSSSGNGVRYDDLGSQRGRWFATHLVAARRVATGTGAAIAAFAQSFIPFERFDPADLAPPPTRK